MILRYSDFKKQLNDGEYFSIYLLEGEDAFFREHSLDDVVSKFVQEKDLNYVCFDGGDFNFDDLISSIDLLPFMSEKRVTAIKEFYPDKKQIEKLKSFLDNPPSDSVLVIVNSMACDALKKFENVHIVDCGKAEPSVINKWINVKCASRGVQALNEASKLIAEYCLYDMSRIENEVLKLCDYVGVDGVIDEEVTNAMVTKDTEYKIYELTEMIGKKKFSDALLVINELLSKGETLQRLLVSLYNYFRRLLHIAISNSEPQELASLLGIKEFAVKKAKEQARMFKVKALKDAVDVLTDADYSFKSGKLDIDNAFWLTTFKIMMGV